MSDETRAEYKLIDDKMKEMKPIFDRMDEDEKLYFMDPYKMKMLPPDHAKDADDVANVTLNDPLTYATKCIAILGNYERQTVVEGQGLTDKKTTNIEQFLDDYDYATDVQLVNKGIMALDAFINEQISIRGSIGGRFCPKVDEEGRLIPNDLPVDTRWLPYENDQNGMAWGAPISMRSKARIEKEYEEELKLRRISLSPMNEVRDYWDAVKNVVFVNKQIIMENPNSCGYPPLVVSLCPIGSTLSSDMAKEHKGESIFWANRDLFPELNRTATIFQTVNLYSLFQALQYESVGGENAGKPAKSPWKPRTVHPIEKGMGYKPMPMTDIKAAARQFYAMLESRLQRGGLTPLDYGSLTFPLSAVAIVSLMGARDDIFWPRLHAIAFFRQARSQMIIKQCLSFGEIKLGKPGHENIYSKSDLEGEYSINYKFILNSKEQKIGDISLANAARGVFSMDTIRRDIVSCQDPDGERIKWESEQAERIDEVLFLYRRASSLITMSESESEPDKTRMQMEAKILGQRIKTILTQRTTLGALSPVEGKGEEPKGKDILPLLAQGGGGARGTRQATPETEEVASEEV